MVFFIILPKVVNIGVFGPGSSFFLWEIVNKSAKAGQSIGLTQFAGLIETVEGELFRSGVLGKERWFGGELGFGKLEIGGVRETGTKGGDDPTEFMSDSMSRNWVERGLGIWVEVIGTFSQSELGEEG